MKFSASEENYIKNIYHLQHAEGSVSASMLAGSMQTTAASVTEMLKKLQVKKVLHYQPYKNFNLTEKGTRTALEIVRKHRLWEFFLVAKLGFNWDEVHEVAEQLEHIQSPKLVSHLDDFLGNPAFDPHGDPIPNSKGKIKLVKQIGLNEVPPKSTVTVCSIKDQSAGMLQMLEHYHISLGSTIRVNKTFGFDGSLEIKTEKHSPAIISEQLAKNIYCVL